LHLRRGIGEELELDIESGLRPRGYGTNCIARNFTLRFRFEKYSNLNKMLIHKWHGVAYPQPNAIKARARRSRDARQKRLWRAVHKAASLGELSLVGFPWPTLVVDTLRNPRKFYLYSNLRVLVARIDERSKYYQFG
jgi:hypothetical protein